MKTTFKFLLILILFILFFIPNIKSFGINMNLISNTVESNAITNDDTNNTSDSSTVYNASNTSSKTVTVTSTDNNEFLTVENVLCIILIVIGILLIFLGIAIIIRFK